MEIGWLQAALVALAAYLGVSVWPFGVGYFTLYRPLIGGTVVGLILGDVERGMAFGAALNAVYLGFVSTGGSLPSDLVTAGYIGAALALSSGLDVAAALSAFGIPLGILGGLLWHGRMTLGSVLAHWADARAARGDTRGVAAINLWAGQGMLFAFYAIPSFLIVYFGQRGIDRLLALVPGMLIDALAVVGGMLPAVGIGLLLRGVARPRLMPYYVIGFTLAVYVNLPIVPIALLATAVAWLVVGRAGAGSGAGSGAGGGVGEGDGGDSAGAGGDCRGAKGVRLAMTGAGEEGAERTCPRVPRRVLWGSWVRWVMFLHASYNYERLQGLGFAHAMKPVIEYLYHTPAARAAALQRHLVLFNSEPQFGAVVPAAVIALEEQRAADGAISDQTIAAVKSGLMGPLAGVGDSMIQGLLTPLLLSMGIALAERGSLAGPVLYALSISAAVLGSSYLFWSLGYRWGRAAVARILSSGWVQALSEGAAIVGVTVTGALAATIVHLSTTALVAVGGVAIALQADVLDAVLRGLLPLALTLLAWWLLSRRVPSMRVIAVFFLAGIDLAYLGLAGPAGPPLLSRAWWTWLLGGAPVTVGSALAHLWPPLLATCLAVGVWAWRGRRGIARQ